MPDDLHIILCSYNNGHFVPCFIIREARLFHPVFYNTRGLIVSSHVLWDKKFGCSQKKEKKKNRLMGQDILKMMVAGKGEWCGPGSTTAWPYFWNATTRQPYTNDFEPHMHKYFATTASKTHWKEQTHEKKRKIKVV